MDYDAANAACKRFKAALTRARNKRDPNAIIKVADDMEAFFNANGWPLPDGWALWDRAREDAHFALRRAARW
jgi:hypothetical protein